MVSKIVTDYLRGLAQRLHDEDPVRMTADVEQLIDLAITLDEERETDLTSILDNFVRYKTMGIE